MVDRVLLAEPRGFCAGVEMAIKALTWMVRVFEPPVYCYHQIVHNQWVVEAFERAGVIFIDDIEQVPVGAPVMLSAHGSAPQVVSGAKDRAGVVVDAVCPLVTKVHHEVRRMADQGYEIIYIGHEGHDEAQGTMAEAPHAMTLVDPEHGLGSFDPGDPSRVALLAQTTLGVHEWRSVMDSAAERFPDLWTARTGRSLLRHHQPTGCCPRAGATVRSHPGGGVPDLVEHLGAGQGGERAGRGGTPHR